MLRSPIRSFADPPSATPARLTAIEANAWEVLTLPSSIVVSGTVTQWTDLSGNGHHFTPTGSPVTDSDGFDTGVLFDGVDDHLDATLSLSDDSIVLFVIARTVVDTPGDYAWVVDASDNGAINRSFEHYHAFGSVVARQSQNDLGNVSYTDANATVALYRIEYTRTVRNVFKNGVWMASSGVATTPARTVTSLRLGARRDGTKPWNGILYAVGVARGPLDDRDIQKREAQFLALAGLTAPFRWPIGAATSTADPRWVLPAVTPAIVGRPLVLIRDSVWYRNGTDITQAATWTGGSFDPAPTDRFSVTPTAAGDTTLTITGGGFSRSTTVRAVDMLAVDAPKKRIMCVGDSRTNRGGSGWIEYLGNDLGSARVEMVGTQGPASGYTYKHEGRDSWTWAAFGTAAGLSGTPSPFFNGGLLDIANYIAQLAAPPDVIIWSLGQNDVYPVTELNLEAAIDAAFGYVDTLLAAWTVALPNVWHILATNSPLAMDPAMGAGSAENRLEAHRKVHRYAERVLLEYGDREDEQIIVCHTFTAADPISGYGDAIHENSGPGHVQLARPYLATLVHHWNSFA